MLSLKMQPWIEVSGLVCISKTTDERLRFRFKGNQKRKNIQIFSLHKIENFDISDNTLYQQARDIAGKYIDGSLSVEYVPSQPDLGIEESHTLCILGWGAISKSRYDWANEQIDWFLNNESDSVDDLGGFKAIHHLSR